MLNFPCEKIFFVYSSFLSINQTRISLWILYFLFLLFFLILITWKCVLGNSFFFLSHEKTLKNFSLLLNQMSCCSNGETELHAPFPVIEILTPPKNQLFFVSEIRVLIHDGWNVWHKRLSAQDCFVHKLNRAALCFFTTQLISFSKTFLCMKRTNERSREKFKRIVSRAEGEIVSFLSLNARFRGNGKIVSIFTKWKTFPLPNKRKESSEFPFSMGKPLNCWRSSELPDGSSL